MAVWCWSGWVGRVDELTPAEAQRTEDFLRFRRRHPFFPLLKQKRYEHVERLTNFPPTAIAGFAVDTFNSTLRSKVANEERAILTAEHTRFEPLSVETALSRVIACLESRLEIYVYRSGAIICMRQEPVDSDPGLCDAIGGRLTAFVGALTGQILIQLGDKVVPPIRSDLDKSGDPYISATNRLLNAAPTAIGDLEVSVRRIEETLSLVRQGLLARVASKVPAVRDFVNHRLGRRVKNNLDDVTKRLAGWEDLLIRVSNDIKQDSILKETIVPQLPTTFDALRSRIEKARNNLPQKVLPLRRTVIEQASLAALLYTIGEAIGPFLPSWIRTILPYGTEWWIAFLVWLVLETTMVFPE